MAKRGAGKAAARIVGEWFAAALPCPRCGGPTEARTNAPKQVGLPWADEAPTRIEWRCVRAMHECTGPTVEETQEARVRLVPDRARPLTPPAAVPGQTYTCTSCGAVWGRALLRCPVDQGAIVPTATLRRSA